MKTAQCSTKHVSHNRKVNGVVLTNGQRTWYDISHSDSQGGDLQHCAIQWKGTGNMEQFTYSHNFSCVAGSLIQWLSWWYTDSKCRCLIAVSFWQTWCHADTIRIFTTLIPSWMPLKHTLPTAIMQTDTNYIEDFLLIQTVFPSKQHNTPYLYSHSHYMTCISDYGAITVGSATLPPACLIRWQDLSNGQHHTHSSPFLPLQHLHTAYFNEQPQNNYSPNKVPWTFGLR